ncbi:NAD(P)/FAD-dependent oxidoreductase [bacterium]|nr:NAD(P)/FAD-dependent oxidoreductase [bacterium]MBU1651938.1 NAD(P)/FAD-dependent oxidoreductase [bacterium]MBU1881380.1 NAD(P)/FAD-dependent oxidoreductase [bacterium]
MSLQYQCLLEPGKIGKLEIPNRIIKAPQSTGLSHQDGSVSERLVRHYRQLAEGGTGLIIVESAYVDNMASKSAHCQLSVCDNENITGLAWLAESIKDAGSRAALQIGHCGLGKFLGIPPIKSASAVTWPALYQRVGAVAVPDPLTLSEIEVIIEAFGDAASRAKAAGFEVVEIHGAHGYLITNFLSPHTNKRNDIYGGSLENRMRFLVQIYDNVRNKVGGDLPVTVRLSGTDYEPDGINIEETIEVCRILESRGIDAIHVSGGDYHQMIHQVSPLAIPAGHNVWAAAAIKKEVNVPVIASGSITSPELAEEIITSGKGDFIALGRPLWADQFWVKKLKDGRSEDIRPCIRCNDGCLERTFFQFRSVTCGVNPTIGREGELEIENTAMKKNIAVIGGGPAGMEAARVCALRGHKVTLFEKRKLGGSLIEASSPRYKSDLKRFINYLQTQVYKLDIHIIQEEATTEKIAQGDFDAVIVATGAKPDNPELPGIKRPFVYDAFDILGNSAKIGKSVIVVGGGMVGTETALWLDEQDKNVTLIEMLDQIMSDCVVTDKIALGEKLSVSKVKVRTLCRLEKITDKGVVVDNGSRKVELQAEAVILAMGYKPDKKLADTLKKETDLEVYCIGDCVSPGKIFDAIHTAYKTARLI